ncbi:MAG: type II toxin-antitoxin system prevent-host-death family antitoxin [Gammaproteobacteria bacterium]|nr:type II toxin-antitoxin system prevent-host-death family antitoxin [Gammaproteobacteria bacterium]
MLTTNITTLRNELPKYLHYVQLGEHIMVTSHGKVVARIMPPLDASKEAKSQLKQLRKTCHVGDVIW